MEAVKQGPVVVVRLCLIAFGRQGPAYGATDSKLVCKCRIKEKKRRSKGENEEIGGGEDESHGFEETRVLIIKQRETEN
jgi:hypothetical protein